MLFNGCDNNRILTKFKDRKSTLVHGYTQRNYTQLKTNISTKHRAKKKIGVNKTANSESVLKTGHLSKMSDPLTFRFSGKVRRQILNLAFLCLQLYYISYNAICFSKGNEFFEFGVV